jgi:hypothetical protein
VQLTDRWGLATTTPDQGALFRYEEMLDGYITFAADLAPDRIQAAMSHDAAPMAQVLFGHFMVSAHTADGSQQATAALQSLEGRTDLTEREAAHVEALAALVAGQGLNVNDIMCDIVAQWPTDIAALRLSHFALFNAGEIGRMESSVRAAAAKWGDDVPRRSYLGGMQAFALEELGRYGEAEPIGRAAVDQDEHDLWSIHSIAHTLEMQQRVDDGLAWMDGRGDVLDSHGSFAGHLWWHHALYLVEAGQFGAALALYDHGVYPAPSTEGLTLSNSVALLARLEFAGADVGDRWQPLAEPLRFRVGVHSHPFNDCHYILGAGFLDDVELANDLLHGMTEWASTHDDLASDVLNAGGLETARGLAAMARNDGPAAESHLDAGLADRWRLGGSHAQRDVFEQARIAAAQRSNSVLAHDLLTARLEAKPGSPATLRWLEAV